MINVCDLSETWSRTSLGQVCDGSATGLVGDPARRQVWSGLVWSGPRRAVEFGLKHVDSVQLQTRRLIADVYLARVSSEKITLIDQTGCALVAEQRRLLWCRFL